MVIWQLLSWLEVITIRILHNTIILREETLHLSCISVVIPLHTWVMLPDIYTRRSDYSSFQQPSEYSKDSIQHVAGFAENQSDSISDASDNIACLLSPCYVLYKLPAIGTWLIHMIYIYIYMCMCVYIYIKIIFINTMYIQITTIFLKLWTAFLYRTIKGTTFLFTVNSDKWVSHFIFIGDLKHCYVQL